MIHDSETNFVFLPQALQLHFPSLFKSLTTAFQEAGVEYDFLPNTEAKEHVWARDYMPIMADRTGGVVKFNYDPDYLRKPQYDKYKPNIERIMQGLGITPFRYQIILDGGNVITDKQGNVYMTDKIFLENPDIPRDILCHELEEALATTNITFVPWDKKDIYGHIDGKMVITDDGTIIDDLSWEYLNFLRVGNNIFFPQLDLPTDTPALARIQTIFPSCTIYPIRYAQTLTRLGGCLHCATWNTIKEAYKNADCFVPSERHPFNPFTSDAFSEKRLRAVVEYRLKGRLDDDDWGIFNEAFLDYWDSRLKQSFSLYDFVQSASEYLAAEHPQYPIDKQKVIFLCESVLDYIIDIPSVVIFDDSFHSSNTCPF